MRVMTTSPPGGRSNRTPRLVALNIALPIDLLERVEDLAAATGRTKAATVRTLLTAGLDAQDALGEESP